VNRARPEAEVDGVPTLELRDEDREAIAELLAQLLVDALERERTEASA
jgi:hypothetical protein